MKKFEFQCLDCRIMFTEEVNDDLAEVFEDIQHDAKIGGILYSSCPRCRENKKNSGEIADMSVKNADS